MDVQYSLAIRSMAGRFKQLEKISTQLIKVVGPRSVAGVDAEWNIVINPQGHDLYQLSLHDTTDRVSTDFTSDELNIPLHVTVRLCELWGDLLQIRHDKQHEVVQMLMSQLVTS